MKKNKFWKSIIICVLVLFCLSSSKNIIADSEMKKTNKPADSSSMRKNDNTPLIAITNQNDESKKISATERNATDIWNNLTDQGKCEYKERILLLVLHPYIQEAVNNYYGEIRQYDNPVIIYIKPEHLDHIMLIRVNTFVGAHNPPYGEDTITFKINSSKIQLLDFTHKTDKGE